MICFFACFFFNERGSGVDDLIQEWTWTFDLLKLAILGIWNGGRGRGAGLRLQTKEGEISANGLK